MNKVDYIKQCIESYPGFPKKGIIFRDIMPILRNPSVLEDVISLFVDYIKSTTSNIEGVAALEARGFLFGPLIALRLGLPFIPIRKAGKLPGDVKQKSYTLEYGKATIEIQSKCVSPGQSVIIVDDLMATGGTMAAAVQIFKESEVQVAACVTIIELTDLNGKAQLPKDILFHSFVQYNC